VVDAPGGGQVSEELTWPAFAGIDCGGEHHQLCVVDTTGKRRTQLRVRHDVAGLHDLDAELHRFGVNLPIAIERSEGLLVEHLQSVGHTLFAVSPRIAARARERYKVAAVKDDRFDAFVLADTLRHEHGHLKTYSCAPRTRCVGRQSSPSMARPTDARQLMCMAHAERLWLRCRKGSRRSAGPHDFRSAGRFHSGGGRSGCTR